MQASVAIKPPAFGMILIEIVVTIVIFSLKKRELLDEPWLWAAVPTRTLLKTIFDHQNFL